MKFRVALEFDYEVEDYLVNEYVENPPHSDDPIEMVRWDWQNLTAVEFRAGMRRVYFHEVSDV